MSALTRLGIDPSRAARAAGGSAAQEQTRETFGYKWARRQDWERPAIQAMSRQWLLERYCGGNPQRLRDWLKGGGQILLDAGCGSGYSAILLFGEHLKEHDYLGVDISSAVEIARTRFAEAGYPGDFLQGDLLDLPIPDESVDLVFAEGVLHHTDCTEAALASLARKLKRGGRFLFYVYARKGPLREFSDDYVRRGLGAMTDEQAWEALKPLTQLGIALGKLNQVLDVPEDIPLLGIRKGPVDLQRFFYWHVCKCFYRSDFGFEEMHLINFDWFRPANCHRHTQEEVQAYCARAGLEIEDLNVQESGITVVARKR